MAIDIPFKASVDVGDGAKSIKSLKQEYKEASLELEGLTVGSEQYIATLKKLGGIKDDIGDLNAEINAFNPEGKIQAFGSVIGGLASGFQAATGAAALFGSESEDVQKALLKVQAVMAFTEGIKGVMGMKDAFTVLGNVIKANPIMFIATIIIGVATAIYAYTKSVDENVEAQKRLNEQLQKELDLLERAEAIRKRAADATLALLQAQGASADQLAATQIANLLAEQEAAKKAYNVKKELYELEKTIQVKGTEEEIKAQADKVARLKKEKEDTQNLFHDLANQIAIVDAALRTKDSQDYQAKLDKDLAAYKKYQADEFKARQDGQAFIQSEKQKAFDAENAAFDKRKSDDQLAFEESQRIEAYKQQQKQLAFDEEVKKIDELAAKKKEDRANEQAAINGSLAAAQASTDSLMALSDAYFAYKSKTLQKGSAAELKAAKDQFNINKALSIASATIMGIQATIAAYQSGAAVPVVGVALGPAMAILAGVTAAANIAKIASMQFNAGGGGSVPTLTATSGGAPPTINAPQNSTTKLNPDGTVVTPPTTKTPVVKAIVVESEMTTTQNRISTITEQATFG